MKKIKVAQDGIVKKYGKALSEEGNEKIVDFTEKAKVDFNFQFLHVREFVSEFKGIMPPSRLAHFVVSLITKGTGHVTIGNFSFALKPMTMVIIPKNVIHTNTFSKDCDGYMISFSENLFEEMRFPYSFLQLNQLFKLSMKPYRSIEKTSLKNFENLFIEIFPLKDCKENIDKKLFILKMAELVMQTSKLYLTNINAQDEHDELFDRFSDMVEANFRTEKEIQNYAYLLTIHPNHLNRVVKQHTELSAKAYLQNRIYYEAKYLLANTKIPIKQIAFDLGFNDSNYFSRKFKSFVGCTPVEYRKPNV